MSLRSYFNSLEPHFEKGGKYEKYYQDALNKTKRILTLVQNRFEAQQKVSKPAEVHNHA